MSVKRKPGMTTMENTTFDWLDSDYSLNYGTPEVPTSRSQASPAAERADQPSGGHPLPLLLDSGGIGKRGRKDTVPLEYNRAGCTATSVRKWTPLKIIN
jgi:hypothetical protein